SWVEVPPPRGLQGRPPPPRGRQSKRHAGLRGRTIRGSRHDIGGPQMTWSIIAADSETGKFGIAVATKFFAVGARVPHIAARLGGIATQALVNPYYGIDGVKLLQEGREARGYGTNPAL